jgi:hypothetical protein
MEPPAKRNRLEDTAEPELSRLWLVGVLLTKSARGGRARGLLLIGSKTAYKHPHNSASATASLCRFYRS